jgi:hypothetical protein
MKEDTGMRCSTHVHVDETMMTSAISSDGRRGHYDDSLPNQELQRTITSLAPLLGACC